MTPGERAGGQYTIERRAGAGSLGTVYLARHVATGEPAAIKVLRDPSEEALKRFAREARALAALQHPHIVRYVDHGVMADGEPYLVMEWLEGEDLGARLASGRLEPAAALRLAARVAEGLEAAHGQGVVHRDIKPQNLFLPQGDLDRVKIVDFGLVHLRDATYALTREGQTLGTPSFMPPEQVTGEQEIDARADLYALGCVLFACLTGRPPFAAAQLVATLAKVVFDEAPPPSSLCPGLPAALDAFVARLLAKKPAARPASAAAVAEALRALEARVAGPASSSAPASSAALTGRERRVASVILAAGAGDIGRGLAAADRTAPLGGALPLDALALTAQALRQVVTRHGAQLELLGDGSLAALLPGAGSPTELATSAARCALTIRGLLPGARVALATGWDEVERTQPMEQVIDRASALLEGRAEGPADGAPPILLDPMTAALLSDRFEVSRGAGALVLAGEIEPADEARRLLGKPTTCVGREHELLLLQATFDECAAESEARAVLVTAGAGVGKSRLRHELVRRLAARGEPVEIWTARGDSMRVGAPFGMLGQIVRRAARLLDGEPIAARRQKLAARVSAHVPEPLRRPVTEFLGEMVGTPFPDDDSVLLQAARQDAKRMGDQMQWAWVELARAECAARPVLLVLEDLHWGDRPTVEYVDAALRLLAGERLMVLALARPEVRKAFPGLWGDRALTELRLKELSLKACERLAREALGPGAPAATVAEIVGRSAGNAFFLEELVRAAMEGGPGGVPETVLAMMQARLGGLVPEARRLLRAASVFGEVFWRGAARALLGAWVDEPELDAGLAELEQRELIARRPDAKFHGEVEYAFRHALLRDAVYEMLTEDDRALGHRLAGEWLAQSGETDAMVLATHFELGGERGRAIDCYRRAAEQALGGNDYAAAIERAERAIACGAAGDELGELDTIKAEAHRYRGDFASAERHAVAAMAALPEGSVRWYRAANLVALAATPLGHEESATALARALCARWSERAARGAELIVMAQAASGLLVLRGECEDAEALCRRIDAVAERFRGDPAVSATILRLGMHRAILAGDLGTARERCEAAAHGFSQAGDARMACSSRSNAGHLCNELGAYAEAAALIRAALADAERLALANTVAHAKENLGRALLHLGALDEARALELEARRHFVAARQRRLEGGTYIYLAEVFRRAGDLAAAEAEARHACELLADVPPLVPCVLATLANVLLAQGRAAEALESAARAAELASAAVTSRGHLETGESLVYLVHAEALAASGDLGGARAAIALGRDRLLARAAKIANRAWRAGFLDNVPENARTLALARAWLGEHR
ncbi:MULTISPECIES: serine/threonine-protein kinase PknK [Sorangium]|uniref:Protein kinase n=1 Tax=Sorangium cellulosum TaxID=56 RepID=A0A4V0NG71_SORCE|nr:MULTISPECIES: serine/threonine-protein kinase [Sorangium]AUX32152.1 protein kinase [Sorangium cellulosum]WCQ91522.1 serine-threonine kinase [Sorangium sp. Soce836]